MKSNRLFWNLLLLVSLLLGSCTQSTTSFNESGNLIQNPGFISNDSPSLAGWQVNNTSWVKVVANAPPGSETWSLSLAPSAGPVPGGTATTFIAGQSGRSVFRFSCWEHNFSNWYWGQVYIIQVRGGRAIASASLDLNDTTWTTASLSDTLEMLPTDTIAIGLRAASLPVFPVDNSPDTVTAGICFNQPSLVKIQQ